MGLGWSNSGKGEAFRILFTSNTKEKKNKTKQESNSLELYVSKRHQLVISICKINAIEMLHLRTASFQCPAMLLQFVQQKFALPD